MNTTSTPNKTTHLDKRLAAVVDENRHPLCFLPMEEILRQKLCHLRIAILVTDKSGNWLLHINAHQIYDFSFCGIVPAQLGAEEYGISVAMDQWGVEILTPLHTYTPCKESMFSFTHIYKIVLSVSMAELFARNTEKYILADTVELAALMEYGCEFSPLFKLFFKKFKPQTK